MKSFLFSNYLSKFISCELNNSLAVTKIDIGLSFGSLDHNGSFGKLGKGNGKLGQDKLISPQTKSILTFVIFPFRLGDKTSINLRLRLPIYPIIYCSTSTKTIKCFRYQYCLLATILTVMRYIGSI